MRCASPTTTRVVLLAGLLAWVLGQWAALKHQIEVLHIVCAEHGEVIEADRDHTRDASAQTADVRQAEFTAPDTEHEHGCGVLLLTEAPDLTAPTSQPPPSVVALTPLKSTPAAPRGPPLAYAPETSPPLS